MRTWAQRLSELDRIAIHDTWNRDSIRLQIGNVRVLRRRHADDTQSIALLRYLLEARCLLRQYREVLEYKIELDRPLHRDDAD